MTKIAPKPNQSKAQAGLPTPPRDDKGQFVPLPVPPAPSDYYKQSSARALYRALDCEARRTLSRLEGITSLLYEKDGEFFPHAQVATDLLVASMESLKHWQEHFAEVDRELSK